MLEQIQIKRAENVNKYNSGLIDLEGYKAMETYLLRQRLFRLKFFVPTDEIKQQIEETRNLLKTV